jgi:hypothetical protein
MEYLERILLEELKKWMDRREILAIKGPRQSGKTTLLEMLKEWLIKERGVSERNVIYLTFEDREILEKFDINAKEFVKRFIQNEKERYYFLIDEAHYSKEIGQKLKLLYDTHKNIKFVITGSSSMEIISSTAKFLVGRVFSFELLPFNFYEFLNVKDKGLLKIYSEKNKLIKELILKGKNFDIPKDDIFIKDLLALLKEFLTFGGYPEVVKSRSEEEKRIVLKNIFNTYLEKDIISFLQITETIKFRKLISTLSSLIGSLINYETLANTCKTYYKDIIHLLDILEQTYIIRLLRPFHKNLVTELRKNPKIYFLDYGLRNYSINNFVDFDLRPDAGKLVENFTLNQIKFMSENLFLNFWRTTAKAEVDFVLSDANKTIPIEVKFQSFRKEKISRSLHSFISNYHPKYAVVLTKDFWGERKIKNTVIKFIPLVYI